MWEEALGGGITAFFDASCPCQTDALLLADFAAPGETEAVCDLGCGNGIIPLLWCRAPRTGILCGVECQPEACVLARAAIDRNHLSSRFSVYEADWATVPSLFAPGSFDRVTVNPPYFPAGSGRESRDPARALARHERPNTWDSVLTAAQYLLKSGGALCLCHRPERLTDVLTALRAHRLEPKRLRLVAADDRHRPFLLLCEGVRDAKPGLTVEPTLFLDSPAFQALITVKEVSPCPEP